MWTKKNGKTSYDEFLAKIEGQHVLPGTRYMSPAVKKKVWIRHDVDYDLEHALRMAKWENENMIRATYFLLPSAPYWDEESSEFAEKILTLRDLGHEVGYHNDSVTAHIASGIPVCDIISRQLGYLRGWAGTVNMTSAHGSQKCYELGYYNYEVWSEYQPDKNEGLGYNGQKAWLSECGLMSDAYFLPYTHYFSDSGGNWIGYEVNGMKLFERSALNHDGNIGTDIVDKFNESGEGFLQVLVHPIHWEDR